MWRYRELLPVPMDARPVTLGEGGTPLIELERLPERAGLEWVRVFLKFEGANPTGSFKDRGMTVAVTLARLAGARRVVVASTGNTAASAAAYAARAGMECLVVLPRGKVARGKLAQALLHGARVLEVDGYFDDALELVMTRLVAEGYYPLNSFNPWRLEGQKTLAYEVVDQLGEAPDYVVVPVGNAGNIAAIWKGFRELHEAGLVDKLPRMVGVQAEGAAPLAEAWRRKIRGIVPVDSPKTVASAIRIGRPVNWPKALRAVEESRGFFVTVSDEEILAAQQALARLEGVGVEPASAAAVAALPKLAGLVEEGATVVVVATGHALKDPDVILSQRQPYTWPARGSAR